MSKRERIQTIHDSLCNYSLSFGTHDAYRMIIDAFTEMLLVLAEEPDATLTSRLAAAESALADERTARMSLETEQPLIEEESRRLTARLAEAEAEKRGVQEYAREKIDRMSDDIDSLTSERDELIARLAEAEARVTELTKQLALRCCAANCDKEELLTADREQRAELTTLRGLLWKADQIMSEMPCYNGSIMSWRLRATAALEGKP
jgi:DNA repair exonuclease SbcCD ATPase subunit